MDWSPGPCNLYCPPASVCTFWVWDSSSLHHHCWYTLGSSVQCWWIHFSLASWMSHCSSHPCWAISTLHFRVSFWKLERHLKSSTSQFILMIFPPKPRPLPAFPLWGKGTLTHAIVCGFTHDTWLYFPSTPPRVTNPSPATHHPLPSPLASVPQSLAWTARPLTWFAFTPASLQSILHRFETQVWPCHSPAKTHNGF